MFTLWDENWLWVENLFLILLKEGDRGSPAPPLMPQESETERNGFIITSYFVDLKTMKSYYLLAMYSHFSTPHFQNYNRQNPKVLNPLSKVSIWGPRGEVSACRERRRTWRGSGRLLIWCYSIPPSDGAGNSRLGKPQNCPFLGLSNLLRDKIFLDEVHKRPAVLLFHFWILTESVGWRNDTGCQWWSSFGSFWWMVLEEIESLSKTTKLLLLDSLLQEVCIESGSDGSLSLSSLGMSVCLVSHNLLYSGLKKAHSKKISVRKRKTNVLECVVLKNSLQEKLLPVGWKLIELIRVGKQSSGVFCFHLTKYGDWESRHAGRDGGHGGAADDCSSDVAASRRRMALATVAWTSLTIFHFLASAIFSGKEYSWMSIIGCH